MAQLRTCFFGVLLAASAGAGCAGAPPPTSRPRPLAVAPANLGSDFPDGDARRVRSRALDFPIELSLPGKASWQIVESPTGLIARHAASASQLMVHTWRADRLVRRSECEAQARLAHPTIPVVHDESVIDRHALTTPAGFDTELVVGVEPGEHGLSGYAVAIGANVGSCYSAVFTTLVARADRADAEQEVARRLGVIVDRVLSGVRVRSVDERAVRHRLQVVPASAPSGGKAP